MKRDFIPDSFYFDGFHEPDPDSEPLDFSAVETSNELIGLRDDCRRVLLEQFEGFVDPEGREESFVTEVYRSGRSYFLYREEAGDTLRIEYEDDYLIITSLHFAARCDLGGRTPSRLVLCEGSVDVRKYAVMNYLSAFYANYLLLKKDCFFFHAAGIVMDDEAYILYGPSESGKSTVSGIASENGLGVLNDELLIIALDEKGCRAYSSPLRGDFNLPDQKGYPVKGFYRLIKSGENGIAPIPRVRAVAEILAGVFYSTYYLKNYESEVFKLVHSLTKTISCYHMHFQKNERFIAMLKESANDR